jgi:alkyldihydroxyacetonephosphate synthase
VSEPKRKFWGWGVEGGGPDADQERAIARALADRFGSPSLAPSRPPEISEIDLPASRLDPPSALAHCFSATPFDRASHTYGKAFRDVVRALRRDFSVAPDLVAYPRDEREVAQVLDWCASARAAAIPYGGGSSVVGGVEARVGSGYRGAVSIDLRNLRRVLEVDPISRAARIEAGAYGPDLEDQLRPHGLTLRHFPQSFEFSTLGGWIATRSGGHYATLTTHIDDFVESLRIVTPTGVCQSRRLPGSGAGPSPDRLFIGSEGALGIITEAWIRLQARPKFRNSTSVTFADFAAAAAAVRSIAQSGLYPANLRLLDAGEALVSGAGDGSAHVLIVAFESADHELDPWMARALECCRDHGGNVPAGAGRTREATEGARDGAAGAWRQAFLRAPYLRDLLTTLGYISDTFETAITWERFAGFHAAVMRTANDAVARICGTGTVTCRFTHVYPDGPAPYFTVLAPARPRSQLEQWDEIKAAVSAAVIEQGGTITHHHAVGRDHRPWYDRQRPDPFARALVAAKRELDPAGIMNPGVLVDADPRFPARA